MNTAKTINVTEFLDSIFARGTHKATGIYMVTAAQYAVIMALLGYTRVAHPDIDFVAFVDLDRVRQLGSEIEARIVEHVAFRLAPTAWVTQDRRRVDIGSMETQHLQNTLNALIAKRVFNRKQHTGLHETQWIRIIQNELLVRVVNKKA